jgi:hypothetical protein
MSPDRRGPDADPMESLAVDPPGARDDPGVASALAAYLADLEAGRQPSRAEWLERYPEIARELADCLDVVEFVRSAAEAATRRRSS